MPSVVYIGNFEPPHSTENHLLLAMRYHGWEVTPMQENDPATFADLARGDWVKPPDFFLWTRTGWDWNAIYPGGNAAAMRDQRTFLRRARDREIPTVGYHLDIWFGLWREFQVDEEPFFDVQLLCTADGGHDAEWQARHIRHKWFPPGVSRTECDLGHPDPGYASLLAFVGSWQGGYHPEHQHRADLVQWLRRNFRSSCAFYPQPGRPAVRGEALRNLYASVDVLVGDSCFAGQGVRNYWSDRIPETLGRGGLLIHPHVPGLEAHFTDGLDLLTWKAGDWDALGGRIEWALSHPAERDLIQRAGRQNVLMYHTYEVRMLELIIYMQGEGLLK